MEKVDIKVRKGLKGQFIEGDYFVKVLDFDECMEFHSKISQDGMENERLIQSCLVDGEGALVFKPQQIPTIKQRLSGVDFMAVLITANGVNDFAKIGDLSEKYLKNSESDQKQD